MKHPFLRFVRGPMVALLVLTATTPVGAEESEDFGRFMRDEIDRFKLWNACEPIYLAVEDLDDDDAKRGLTREAITTTVRSRLRAARLYSSEYAPSQPYLYANVNTLSGESRVMAYSTALEFKKSLPDPKLNGLEGHATTWETGVVGQGDAAYILSSVSRLTDKFIDEYLRVNDSACQGPGQR